MKPLVIAHRGASGYRPDHTRSGYLLALEMGADAIEPDLVSTKDGVLVIRHENEISQTTDIADKPEFADRKTTKVVDGETLTGWFTEDFTWAELSTLRTKERIPQYRPANAAYDGQDSILRFIDLLEIADTAPRPLTLVVEIKHPTYFDQLGLRLDELIARDLFLAGWDPQDPRLIMESFEKTIVVRLKEKGIGAKHFYIMDFEHTAFDELVWAQAEGVPSISNQEELSDAGLTSFSGRLDGLALATRLLLGPDETDVEGGRRLVARAHELGLKVFAWTLRAENIPLPNAHRTSEDGNAFGDYETHFGNVFATGVDGVFSDQPDLAVRSRP